MRASSAFPFGWLRGGEGPAELQAEPCGLRSVGDEHNQRCFRTALLSSLGLVSLQKLPFPTAALVAVMLVLSQHPGTEPISRRNGRGTHLRAQLCPQRGCSASTLLPWGLPFPPHSAELLPQPRAPTYGAEGAAGSGVSSQHQQKLLLSAGVQVSSFLFLHLAGGRALSTNSNMPSGLGVSSQPLTQNPDRGLNRGTSVPGPQHAAPRASFLCGLDQSTAALWVEELTKLSPEAPAANSSAANKAVVLKRGVCRGSRRCARCCFSGSDWEIPF